MSKEIVQFPMFFYNSLVGLLERKLMTPSYLSRIIMLAVLPAKFLHLHNINEVEHRNNHLYFAFISLFDKYKTNSNLDSSLINGIETEEIKSKTGSSEYLIYFCGNCQDAITSFARYIDTDKNLILWNYPGVGRSLGGANSAYDLFEAGYEQVKILIDKGTPANQITLHGFSLGGGVATHVARRLHEEGLLVNLEVYCSFSSLTDVVIASIKKKFEENIYIQYAPLITSIIAFGISGIAVGTTFAGLLASVSLLVANLLMAVGYSFNIFFLAIGYILQGIIAGAGKLISCFFSLFSKSLSEDINNFFSNVGNNVFCLFSYLAININTLFLNTALFFDKYLNLISSIISGIISLCGLLAGILVGSLFGSIFSLQLFFTKNPYSMPMKFAFSAALYSACCEMDSIGQINRLLNLDKSKSANESPMIKVINTVDDPIIDISASLNNGLGVNPTKKSKNNNQFLLSKINSIWYSKGEHSDTDLYEEDVIDMNNSSYAAH